MKKRYRSTFTAVFLAILSLGAAASLFIGAKRAIAPGGSQDAQYCGAVVLMHGQNPYFTWLGEQKAGRYFLNQDPNYLPNLYYMISPLTFVDWPKARFVWMAMNIFLAIYFAWLIAVAQKSGSNNILGCFAALFFLSSTPLRNCIGNGQSSLLILVATVWAWRLQSRPVAAGGAYSISLVKYSFGPFFIVAEIARRRIIAIVVAAVVVLAGYAALAFQTHSVPTLAFFTGPLDVAKTGFTLSGYFLWLNQFFGYKAVRALPLLGLVVLLIGAMRLTSASLSAQEISLKLICAATFASFLFAPHAIYDFIVLALPLAAGCRLAELKTMERWIYSGAMIMYWGLSTLIDHKAPPILSGAHLDTVLNSR